MKMDPDCGPWRAAPVPPVAAQASLPLFANLKLSGSVDPYLSSEPHHWRQLNPGSLDFQHLGASTDTRLFATGTLEIFQDLSGYCQPWGSCQPSTSMGNAASTSFSASEGELNTPEIGAVSGFEFISSADNINQLGDDFCPEVLDAFLNSAEDVDIVEDDHARVDSVEVAEDEQSKVDCAAEHDLGLVEHEEVVGGWEELPDPLSCGVKCESVGEVAEEPHLVSRSPAREGDRPLFEDLPVLLPGQLVAVGGPKLDLGLLLEPAVTPGDVIGTPEVLNLLCDTDVGYDWPDSRDSSTPGSVVSRTSVTVELPLPAEEPVASGEACFRERDGNTSGPAARVSRKRKGAALVDSEAAVSPAPAKRGRRARGEEGEPSSGASPAAGRRPRLSASSAEEDICQKYRELRDRNNEASRRSRLNRKTQDEEMKKSAEHLEAENERLRVKVEKLEKLRDKVKEALFSLVKGNSS
ncbi:uncharacterized protein LOC134538190 [Bacillus rossius redtenbacheri]|uniref:uncharacterized protein LOC134538190 n=1 Tax=Bacillus rossius redtenbacheri TaxID=93214 RepID=UPI002FDE9F25